jgi:hypothetical protein
MSSLINFRDKNKYLSGKKVELKTAVLWIENLEKGKGRI